MNGPPRLVETWLGTIFRVGIIENEMNHSTEIVAHSPRDLTGNPVYWTPMSTVKESASDLNRRIAGRVRELRAEQSISLTRWPPKAA